MRIESDVRDHPKRHPDEQRNHDRGAEDVHSPILFFFPFMRSEAQR